MFSFVLGFLWHSLIGWVGIAGIVVIGSLAVAWFLPPFRRLAINVAIGAVLVTVLYAKGYHDGTRNVQGKWRAAEEQARRIGDTARADALRDAAGSLRDPFDSDDH